MKKLSRTTKWVIVAIFVIFVPIIVCVQISPESMLEKNIIPVTYELAYKTATRLGAVDVCRMINTGENRSTGPGGLPYYVSPEMMQKKCMQEYALLKNDPKICKLLGQESLSTDSKYYSGTLFSDYKYNFQDNCLLQYAAKKRDPKACFLMTEFASECEQQVRCSVLSDKVAEKYNISSHLGCSIESKQVNGRSVDLIHFLISQKEQPADCLVWGWNCEYMHMCAIVDGQNIIRKEESLLQGYKKEIWENPGAGSGLVYCR